MTTIQRLAEHAIMSHEWAIERLALATGSDITSAATAYERHGEPPWLLDRQERVAWHLGMAASWERRLEQQEGRP